MDSSEQIQNIPTFGDFYQMFLGWPQQTQIGIVMFAATWLIGGNILMYFSMKRRGIPYWKVLVPSFKTTFGLSGKEYLILAVLAFTSLSFAVWGISAQ